MIDRLTLFSSSKKIMSYYLCSLFSLLFIVACIGNIKIGLSALWNHTFFCLMQYAFLNLREQKVAIAIEFLLLLSLLFLQILGLYSIERILVHDFAI